MDKENGSFRSLATNKMVLMWINWITSEEMLFI
jgi:hypothetical protein